MAEEEADEILNALARGAYILAGQDIDRLAGEHVPQRAWEELTPWQQEGWRRHVQFFGWKLNPGRRDDG